MIESGGLLREFASVTIGLCAPAAKDAGFESRLAPVGAGSLSG
ncbi:MAG TPA: hypothetical protein [Caudoviricetes sp.]|nr:MAG TPA: hypothetical protein [Caudoviricetes sp.]